MDSDSERIAAALVTVIQRENKRAQGDVVHLAYLHGTRACGRADQESDIDIGILAAPSLDKGERFKLRIRLMRALADTLHEYLEKIDLIILQDVPVLLQFNVVRKGILLFGRTRQEKIEYELQVEREYDDERYYLQREADITINRILSRPAA